MKFGFAKKVTIKSQDSSCMVRIFMNQTLHTFGRENHFTSARQQTKMIVANKLSQWRQLLPHRKTGVQAKSEKKG